MCAPHFLALCVYVCDMYVHLCVNVGEHMPLFTCGHWRIISGVSPYLTTCFETGYRPQPSGLLLTSPILLEES